MDIPTLPTPAEAPTPTEPTAAKKPYQTPELTVHGTIAQITEGNGGNPTDGINGSLLVGSDRAIKQDFMPVDAQDILTRLAAVPVSSWAYNADPATRHIGPMAQDFLAAFGVGDSDKHIHMVDANGVAMAALQALYAKFEQRDREIEALRSELDALKEQIAP